MDMPAQRLSRRLQRTLLAFFLLAVLFLVVVYVAAPSIYTNTLSLIPSPTGHSPGLCCKKSGRDAMDVKAHLPVQLRPPLQTGWR